MTLAPEKPTWFVYLLDCDGRLYTGISTSPERRLQEHREGGSRAAKFTRAAQRVELRLAVDIGNRSLALQVEARIKRMPRVRKLALLEAAPTRERLLELLDIPQ